MDMDVNKTFNFDEIRREIEASPSNSTIYVGADSQVFRSKKTKDKTVTYVTVIILHYGSARGAKIFRSYTKKPYYDQIRMRLMDEVQLAIDAALPIIDVIGDRGFEIHLDINRNKQHKSSVIIREATGYVLGMLGIQPKLKPDSFAASCVADRFCHSR